MKSYYHTYIFTDTKVFISSDKTENKDLDEFFI